MFIMTENHYNNQMIRALRVMTFTHQVEIPAKIYRKMAKNHFMLKDKQKNQCLLIRI